MDSRWLALAPVAHAQAGVVSRAQALAAGCTDAALVHLTRSGRWQQVHPGVLARSGRDNAAAVEGEVTLRYGWHDVDHLPCEVARQAATVLVGRGRDASTWRGCLTCGRSPAP